MFLSIICANPSFFPIIFCIVSQYTNPLRSKMSNRVSITTSLSSWLFPFLLSLVLFFRFPLPLTFVPCSSVQQTSSNLIQLFLFFAFVVIFPPGSYSLSSTLHSFLIFRSYLTDAYIFVLCQTLFSFPVSCLQNPIILSSLALFLCPWVPSFSCVIRWHFILQYIPLHIHFWKNINLIASNLGLTSSFKYCCGCLTYYPCLLVFLWRENSFFQANSFLYCLLEAEAAICTSSRFYIY